MRTHQPMSEDRTEWWEVILGVFLRVFLIILLVVSFIKFLVVGPPPAITVPVPAGGKTLVGEVRDFLKK